MRAIASIALSALLAVAAGVTPALAQNLNVPLDHTVRLSVMGEASSVVVGNAKVADVTVVDTHTLFVLGKSSGATDVVVLDRAGRTIYANNILVSAPDAGHVSVYRGAGRTELFCAPNCTSKAADAPAAAGDDAPPAAAPPSP